jgi:hypothetical protein
MRILVGCLGILLSLPWVFAFGVFYENFKPRDRLLAGPLALVFGACLVAAAGSLFKPSWRRAGVWALAVLGVFYAAAVVSEVVKREKKSSPRRPLGRGP